MIAVDTNILVYAHQRNSPFYVPAFAAMRRLAEGAEFWGIPVGCIHEFLSVVTNPKIPTKPSTPEQAMAQIDAWLESPSARILHTGSQHWRILSQLARTAKIQGGQYHDARIAATCIEHGVSVLWSMDRDFSRFKALKTSNPLI